MYANMKRMNNDMAVSPIVATLVLIVVAVIGAVAVGTIMGTFSTSVSKNVNSNQANAASQMEILVAGSTTIDPITQAAAKVYSATNPGVKITSQAIASGAGIQAVGNGVADIGATSDGVSAAQLQQFPQLQSYQIGMGAIVVIQNAAKPAVPSTVTSLTFGDLQAAFIPTGDFVPSTINAAVTGDVPTTDTVVIRADSSGTAKTFFKFLNITSSISTQPSSAGTGYTTQAVNGNQLLVQTVGSTSNSIGFADYGDVVPAVAAGTVTIVPYQDETNVGMTTGFNTYTFTNLGTANAAGQLAEWNSLRTEAKGIYGDTIEVPGTAINQTASTFHASNVSMIRGLYYVTNGAPSATVKNYINFVQSSPVDPTSSIHEGIFQETNNFGLADIA